ncbi:unnamed protein product [Ceratitis capitata]|uniref:(Mediterranean fruit fly) hypothetical protein n=1 Tax=Ceratitis capitata TaxID=7213 RepID=A0A811UU64_CERCA|nr:unnamed protein product [Ceratitis capitata]
MSSSCVYVFNRYCRCKFKKKHLLLSNVCCHHRRHCRCRCRYHIVFVLRFTVLSKITLLYKKKSTLRSFFPCDDVMLLVSHHNVPQSVDLSDSSALNGLM